MLLPARSKHSMSSRSVAQTLRSMESSAVPSLPKAWVELIPADEVMPSPPTDSTWSVGRSWCLESPQGTGGIGVGQRGQ